MNQLLLQHVGNCTSQAERVAQVLMRALRDFNIPKIVTDDLPVFMGLIGDLFPALDVPRKRDFDFEKMCKQAVHVSDPAFLVLTRISFFTNAFCPVLARCRVSLADAVARDVVIASLQDLKLQAEENFVLKLVQLDELLFVRHSVFVIGNAGTGKTQVCVF